MSDFKGTPGPWTAYPGDDYNGARIDGPNGRSVAFAIQRDAHPVHGQGITQAEAKANGCLIAAAHDLLAALQLCYDHCRLYHREVERNNVGEAVCAALAKAGAAP